MDPIPPEPSRTPELRPLPGTKLEKEIGLKNGETVVLPSFQIERMRLFHGSPIPGITEFTDAEETTIGDGFYTTSNRNAAIGYAGERSSNTSNRFLYEVEINDMNILNLTTQDSIRDFSKLFKEALSDMQGRIKADNEVVAWWAEEKLRETIELIDDSQKIGSKLHLKEIAFSYGDLARDTLTKLGYDGLVAIEGGEGSIGNHDSYVIFDPRKARVMNEEPAVLINAA